ncbi:unnamed protein product [Ascophyllum nodosum]
MAATGGAVNVTPTIDAVRESSVYSLYAADVVSGVGASFLVSPSITILDRAITLRASGAMKISDSIREGVKEMILRPHVFHRRPEFLMIWGVYAATYVTANMIMTTCERSQVDDTWPKLIGTTIVNITTVVAKDLQFTRMFATVKPRPVPTPTYLLFTARDGMTVAASFNMPRPASKYLQERFGMSQKNADVTAQLACPSGIQILSTPLNLLGMDLYNNPNSTMMARGKFIASEYTSAMILRVSRTGPAFGIGGVGNTTFRKYFASLFTS